MVAAASTSSSFCRGYVTANKKNRDYRIYFDMRRGRRSTIDVPIKSCAAGALARGSP